MLNKLLNYFGMALYGPIHQGADPVQILCVNVARHSQYPDNLIDVAVKGCAH